MLIKMFQKWRYNRKKLFSFLVNPDILNFTLPSETSSAGQASSSAGVTPLHLNHKKCVKKHLAETTFSGTCSRHIEIDSLLIKLTFVIYYLAFLLHTYSVIFHVVIVIIFLEIQGKHSNTKGTHLICTLKDYKKANEVMHFFEGLEISLLSYIQTVLVYQGLILSK